jgi:hypothetical protein
MDFFTDKNDNRIEVDDVILYEKNKYRISSFKLGGIILYPVNEDNKNNIFISYESDFVKIT